jgi:hypothetical protein
MEGNLIYKHTKRVDPLKMFVKLPVIDRAQVDYDKVRGNPN